LAHIWYRAGSIAAAADLQVLKEKGTFIIPTLSVLERLSANAAEQGNANSFLSFEQILKEVGKAKEAGLNILAGTDSPNFGMNYHDQLFEELIFLTQAGLTEVEALRASTSNIYHTFDLEAFSPLKAGSPASFILIEGKPLEQIEDIRRSKRIWKNGQEIRGT
ncbi:MAG: amidohydrolase family protein, partial [Saprospiraceae bacterium]|nr:amidohydrolase family protein [Saprospiraceae bacterium]